MKNIKQISALALAMLLAAAMSGCAAFARCSPENCATDKNTLADVNHVLAAHSELGPPAAIHVQVINGVVYLSGLVSTEMEVRSAEGIALQVRGVKKVVNSLSALSNGR